MLKNLKKKKLFKKNSAQVHSLIVKNILFQAIPFSQTIQIFSTQLNVKTIIF